MNITISDVFNHLPLWQCGVVTTLTNFSNASVVATQLPAPSDLLIIMVRDDLAHTHTHQCQNSFDLEITPEFHAPG